MTDMRATRATDGVATYLGRGDRAGRFADYYPAWVDKLAGDGHTQHIAAHYRPLSSLMFFSRLLRERFAGAPYADRFLAGAA